MILCILCFVADLVLIILIQISVFIFLPFFPPYPFALSLLVFLRVARTAAWAGEAMVYSWTGILLFAV